MGVVLIWGIVAIVALLASALAAVAGFGGAVVLLPVLVWAFGVRDAVPILTVIQLVGNGSRVGFNRRQIVWPVAGWFALGAVPLAAVGGLIFAVAPAPLLTRVLGAFLLVTVAYRHTPRGRSMRISLRGFAGLGAVAGFLSALVGTVGPLAAPFFLAYGLVKGAYIGTEALTALTMHAVKLSVYGGAALLTLRSVGAGLALGLVMVAGTFTGKRLLDRIPERVFPRVVEAVLVVSGLQLLFLG
ncbi:MAG: sulfite exporter TauE/SafE family protein [Rhodoglobus sp.]|nr:sulfite exporter TauE/SafE family protein [Rhodoglobus sp.]